jgi:hypothetical protein
MFYDVPYHHTLLIYLELQFYFIFSQKILFFIPSSWCIISYFFQDFSGVLLYFFVAHLWGPFISEGWTQTCVHSVASSFWNPNRLNDKNPFMIIPRKSWGWRGRRVKGEGRACWPWAWPCPCMALGQATSLGLPPGQATLRHLGGSRPWQLPSWVAWGGPPPPLGGGRGGSLALPWPGWLGHTTLFF